MIYKPYYLLSFLGAGIIVWGAQDTWGWTQQISWRKAVACIALFWIALLVLATQAYNPFIYFIF